MTKNRNLCVALALLLAGCGYSESSYRGDGTLTDRGWLSGSDRYVLDLGSIDLTRAARRQFSMTNLPPERMAIGLEILPASGFEELGPNFRLPFSPVVHLRVASSSRVLIDDQHQLREWLLSTAGGPYSYPAFAYCRGVGAEWNEQAGTAWGCVLRPDRDERYITTLEVIEPDASASRYRVRLLVRGGSGFAS